MTLRLSSLARGVALATLLALPVAAHAVDTKSALAKLGFPADTEAKVLAGKFVETELTTVSDRDLNVGIAFLVTTSPEVLTRKLFDDLVLQRVDPGVLASGKLAGDGSAAQLAALQLTDAQQRAYAAAAPGADLNLSTDEIAALASAGTDPAVLATAVRTQLLARYRAYRTKGLAGIAPYARDSGTSDPAADFTAIDRAARAKALLPSAFYDLLDGYPTGKPTDLTEVFTWSQFRAHDADTIALTHAFAGTFGGTMVAVQRQYYASTGYNAEQAIAGFVPVQEGTLVVYTNHTATDQVTGFGGGAKRSIGRKFMASQLQGLFTKLQAAVQ